MRIRLKRGRLIQELAKSRLSQAAWARRLGVSESYLSRLINGERSCPGARTRRRLLSVLDLDLEELFDVVDQRQGEPQPRASEPDVEAPSKSIPGWKWDGLAAAFRGNVPGRKGALMDRLMSAWFVDFRSALRFCRNNPGFLLISTSLLGLGIGVNCAIFGLLNTLVLRPLPFPNSDELVRLNTTYLAAGQNSVNMSYPDIEDLKERSKSLADLAVFDSISLNLRGREVPERVRGFQVSRNLFELLGVRATRGRIFSTQDAGQDTTREVIISQRLFRRLYGEDPKLIGSTITLDGVARTVIGVIPDLRFSYGGEAWIPLETDLLTARTARALSVIGRLNPGTELEAARAELNAIAAALESEYPESNEGRGIRLQTFAEAQTGDVRLTLLVLNGMALVILLIACANVSNLLLSRAVERRHESAVRMALGAVRWRIIRHGLTESLVVASLGGLAGLALAWLTFRFLVANLPPEAMLQSRDLWNPTLFGFAFALAFGTSVVFGILPALLLARADPQVWLRSGGRGGSSEGARIRGAFVAIQVAVAIILLAGAGLMVSSLLRLWAVDIGFDPSHLLTMRIDLPGEQYESPESRQLFADRLIARLDAIPGVQSAALTTSLPLGGLTTQTTVRLEGQPAVALAEAHLSVIHRVSPELLSTLGIPLLRGRGISSLDTRQSPRVVLVNETLARRMWGSEPAIGKVLVLGRDDPHEVVGVVANTVYADRKEEESQLYIPFAQQPTPTIRIMLRTRGDASAFTPQVRTAVQEIDPDRPIYDVDEMENVVLLSLAEAGAAGILISSFAVLALLMSALGIYGLIAFWVQQNTHELGIRVALGASRRRLVKYVLLRSLREVLIGCVIGLIGAAIVGQALRGVLYQVGALDPLSYGAVVLIILGTAVIACYLPTRRALRVDPLTALRCE